MMTVPVRYILLNEERCRSDPRMVRGEPAQKGMSRKNNGPRKCGGLVDSFWFNFVPEWHFALNR